MGELGIAIPSNILEDCQSLFEKSYKLGLIARAASIFNVTNIHIYENQGRSEKNLIMLILRYLVTPQYLRKQLFPIQKELKFAGILPPLKIPSHTVSKNYNLNKLNIRDGICIKFNTKIKKSIIDIGLNKFGILNGKLAIGKIITVSVLSYDKDEKYFLVKKIKPEKYWGYDINYHTSLKSTLKSPYYDIKIITSKFGSVFTTAFKDISDKLLNNSHSNMLIVFGSPKIGLMSVLKRESIATSDLFIINLFPNQGVETVRSEEAILSGLSLFNSLIYSN